MIDDARLAIAIMKAIAGRESGRGTNLTDEEWQQAHRMFKAGSADAYLEQQGVVPATEKKPAATGPSGAGLVRRARQHIGEEYRNRQVPKDDPDWKGPWDCAEFVSWLVYQEGRTLYGCLDDKAKPALADAYTGAWRDDVERLGIRVSVDKAAATVGGIVLRYPPSPGAMGHIAVCDGEGGTIEAKGVRFGVVADTVHGRRWDTGILVPGIAYDEDDGLTVREPDLIYRRNAPNMNPSVVAAIQRALQGQGFFAGALDGQFSPETEAAVIAFQKREGLVVDGEVGPSTAAALGVSLTATDGRGLEISSAEGGGAGRSADVSRPADLFKGFDLFKSFDPKILASLGLGAGAMNPFVLLAAQVLPGIIQAVAGDKAGAIAQTVAKTVKDVTGKDTAEAAADKLRTDAAAVATLQIKLAEIAAEQDNARRQAHLDEIKVQIQAEARRQEQDLEKLRIAAEDTKGARATWLSLAQAQVPMAWGAPAVSIVVTVGFFAFMAILMAKGLPRITQDDGKQVADPNVMQIINIVVGALTTAFATVVSFWLGSSQGSRLKDVAAIKREDEQAARTEPPAVAPPASRGADGAVAKPKPSDQLNRCLEVVLLKETAVDSAASTRYGLTRDEVAETLRKAELSAEDFQKLTREEAAEIYRVRYWNVLNCDKLPLGVDLVVLDVAAEADVVRAAKLLQEVLGVKEDGSIGPVSLGALQHQTPRAIITRLSELRRERLRAGRTGGTAVDFTRIDDVERAAREMIDRAADK